MNYSKRLSILSAALLIVVAASACTMVMLPTDGAPLSDADVGTEETVRAASAPQPGNEQMDAGALEGTTWALFAYGQADALEALVVDSEVMIEFGQEGDLTGNAGCNRFMTTFEVTGNLLSVGSVGLTRMMCVDAAIQDQEYMLVNALEGMAAGQPFRLVGDQLEIQLADGSLLIFTAE